MKQGGLIIASFVLVFASVVPLAAQEKTANYQTYIMESFDSPDTAEWTWQAVGSKFVTEGFPILKYYDGMPHALSVMQGDSDTDYKFLGMQFKFDRKGDNWVDIVPMKDDAPYEIPFKGIVSRIDMWCWGAGYYYDLEVLVRDVNGRVHALELGSLSFQGWKNMAVRVPTSVPQNSKYIGDDRNMKFVAFRIRTSPMERVNNYHMFFDQVKVLTNTFVDSYDGYELVNAKFDDAETETEGK